jgi:cytoskeletal protein RodZ
MRARDWGRRRWSLVLIAVAGAIAVLVVIVVAATTRGGGRHPSATPSAASAPSSPVSSASEPEVTISSPASLTPIPRSFLGFSTEYWTLPVDEHHIGLYRRLLYSVHVPGDGPLILRIGGDSSGR